MTRIQRVIVSVLVRASPERAWTAFITPDSITKWNFARPDWHCPCAENESHHSLGPDRKVVVQFADEGRHTRVSQSISPEATHSLERRTPAIGHR
jgi:uncharacterized protein YndB with AHSA1/START domain